MTARTTWPHRYELVRGDPWRIPIDMVRHGAPYDLSGTEWQADIRRYADGPLLDSWDIEVTHPPDSFALCRLLLTLPPDRTRNIPDGAVFDLQQTAPGHATWLICERLNVAKDASR